MIEIPSQPWPLTRRFDEAVAYATYVHEGHYRKATRVAYLAHLLAVCALVLEDGGTEDEAIAALLHDAVEDAGGKGRLAALRERFGGTVAHIVAGCSDADATPKPEWRVRKEQYIAHLRKGADAATRRVSLADKLHNARAILRDHRRLGERIWKRFNAPARDQLWYYGELVVVFRKTKSGPMVEELARVVDDIRAQHRAGRKRGTR